jgi:hypothetical protein
VINCRSMHREGALLRICSVDLLLKVELFIIYNVFQCIF